MNPVMNQEGVRQRRTSGLDNIGYREHRPIYEGFMDTSAWKDSAPCPSCHQVVRARAEVRDGYRYLQKYCPQEKALFESLIEKVSPCTEAGMEDVARVQFDTALGERDVAEADILNWDTIQNLWLHLTPQCNSTCSVCYDRYLEGRKKLTVDQIAGVVSRVKHKQIILAGGEPTVRQDLPELIALVCESGNVPVLFTNGLKLANERYLKELVRSGLGMVYLSFEGFREEIYERMRGGRHEFRLKMAALGNLDREQIRTSLSVTIVRGVNETEIGALIDYMRDHPRSVWDIAMQPVYLPGVDPEAGMGKYELVSRDEISGWVSQHLGIDPAYHRLWYDAKQAFVDRAKAFFPRAGINAAYFGHMYFQRERGTLQPLLSPDVLIRLTKALRARRWIDPVFVNPKVLRLFGVLLQGRLRQADIECRLAKDYGVARISQGIARLPEDIPSSMGMVCLAYSGNGVLRAASG